MNLRLTVDVIIFSIHNKGLSVLLVKRKIPPFVGAWAIPGGFIHEGESLEDAARRELLEETGVSGVYLEQLYTFGDPRRDPRGRVVSVAYFAIVPAVLPVSGGSDAVEAKWFEVSALPKLAFDHQQMLDYARERLCNKLEYTTVGFKLLPEKFTLSELQRVYESVLGKRIDKRNFRRKLKLLRILEPLKEFRKDPTRPAQLYRLNETKFAKLKDMGILFPF